MNKSDEEKKYFKNLYEIQVSIVLISLAKETIERFVKEFPNIKDYTKDKSLYHALHSSAITLYAKPFTKNYGEKRIDDWELDWDTYPGKINDVKLKCLHLKLIECRDKIYAHQDSKYITVNHIVIPKIKAIPKNEENTLVVDISNLLIPFISQEDIQLMPKLCDKIIGLLYQNRKKAMKKCACSLNGKSCEITSSGAIK